MINTTPGIVTLYAAPVRSFNNHAPITIFIAGTSIPPILLTSPTPTAIFNATLGTHVLAINARILEMNVGEIQAIRIASFIASLL